jgi:hypothetical protein
MIAENVTMTKAKECEAPRPPTGSPRPDYEAGDHFTAAECQLEQRALLQRLRHANRQLHGCGIVCGMWVVPAGDPKEPWAVQVCPGYAVGPYGDEIQVTVATTINLKDFLWSMPQLISTRDFRRIPYLVIRYDESTDRTQAIPAVACKCTDPDYCDTRTVDSFRLGVLWKLTEQPFQEGVCGPESMPCPACPDSPWLVLARILLPGNNAVITATMIDNDIRTAL